MTDQEEYLISFANLKSELFKFQKNFLDEKCLKQFYNYPYFGMPQCLPAGIKYFNYSGLYEERRIGAGIALQGLVSQGSIPKGAGCVARL